MIVTGATHTELLRDTSAAVGVVVGVAVAVAVTAVVAAAAAVAVVDVAPIAALAVFPATCLG